ncbi:MAG: SusC/RagA family TonB-linked outer membrane protein [Rikenellaceae bacterium]
MKKTLLFAALVMFGLAFSTLNASAAKTSANSSAIQQDRTATGVVYDETGATLPGVVVSVPGTSNATTTNYEGRFELRNVAVGTKLAVSFIGYATQEVDFDGRALSVNMETDNLLIEELVVVGYGAVKKSDLTGSVASLSNETLTSQKKTSVANALQGQIAGVDVRVASSKPGVDPYIRIRGNTSIKNNIYSSADGVSTDASSDLAKPLYVIDGVFMESMLAINPSDIQQMDVLKDASATAIYGSRGANGVVIITTKSGQGASGKTTVSYDGTVGVNWASNIPDFNNGDEYVAVVDDMYRSTLWISAVKEGNGTAEFWNSIDAASGRSKYMTADEITRAENGEYFDWVDAFTSPSVQTSHTVAFSGNENGLAYAASIGYLMDQGVLGDDERYDRYTANLSLSKKFGRKDMMTVGVKNYFAFTDTDSGSPELFRTTMRMVPTVTPWDENGDLIQYPDANASKFPNPYNEDEAYYDVTRSYNYNASLYFDIKPTEWMSFSSTFAPEIKLSRTGLYRGLATKSVNFSQSSTRADYSTSMRNTYTWDNVLNFTTGDKFEGHKFTATFVQSIYNQQNEGSSMQSKNFETDSYLFYNLSKGSDWSTHSTSYSKRSMASFAGRFNYDMFGKYLFTFTARADGSSMLADGHKWGYFPSAAVAWRISEEDFMKHVDPVNNLKLRLSWGKSGNINGLSPYDSQVGLSSTSYMGDVSTTVNSLINSELSWELSTEYNVGIDVGLINDRIRLTADWYHKTTTGAIFDKSLMNVTGFSSSTGNYGSALNTGIELSLSTVNIQTRDFTWSTTINFAKNHNEILSLESEDGAETTMMDIGSGSNFNKLIVGEDITSIYYYKPIGIWQMSEWEEALGYGYYPGMYKFEDVNGDGSYSSEDYQVIGSEDPTWTGSMTNTFTWRNLTLSVMVTTRQGSFGHSEFLQNFVPWGADDAMYNSLDMDYWTPNTTDSTNPMVNVGTHANYSFADMSYVRVSNIGLSYTFPNLKNVQELTISCDVQNPFTFTDYLGPDPESGLSNSYEMTYLRSAAVFGVSVKF